VHHVRRRMSSASSTHLQLATEPNVNVVHDTAKALASLREYIIQCGSKPASHRSDRTTQCNPSRMLRSSVDKLGEIEQDQPSPFSTRLTCRRDHNKAVGLELHESSLCATELSAAVLGNASRPGGVAHGDGWLVERRLAQTFARCRHKSRKLLASPY
jgi:hypothetical protein